RQAGVVEGGEADPRDAAEQRARTVGAHVAAGRRLVAGKHGAGARQTPDGAAVDAAALPLVTGAGGDEGVVAGAVGVAAVLAVGGDRAVHEAGVLGEQHVGRETQLLGGTGAPG